MRAPVVKRSYLAALMVVPALYCGMGVAQALMLTQQRLAYEIWLALTCLFVIAGAAIAMSAWRLSRRLSREERANLVARRSETPSPPR